MASYKLSRSARTDLREIYRYGFLEFGESQADRYVAALLLRFEQIAGNPFQFPAVDHIREGYRRAVYGAHSIYYRIENDGVEVMRLLSRQDATEVLR